MALGFDPRHDPDDLLIDVSERPSRLQRLFETSVRRLRALRGPFLPWQQRDQVIPVQVDLVGDHSGVDNGLTPDHPFRRAPALAPGESSAALSNVPEAWSFNEPVLLRSTGQSSRVVLHGAWAHGASLLWLVVAP